MEYLQLKDNDLLPYISNIRPFKRVLVIEMPVSQQWQTEVSRWLVSSGCLYMLAWGINCSAWDDSVDIANLEEFDYREIPADKFVMTTWHDNASLSEFFEFCKKDATHEAVNLENTLLLHISSERKLEALTSEYARA